MITEDDKLKYNETENLTIEDLTIKQQIEFGKLLDYNIHILNKLADELGE